MRAVGVGGETQAGTPIERFGPLSPSLQRDHAALRDTGGISSGL